MMGMELIKDERENTEFSGRKCNKEMRSKSPWMRIIGNIYS